MSNTAKFWIGVVLALPVVIVGSIIVGIASGIGSALDDTGTASAILGGVASLVELVACRRRPRAAARHAGSPSGRSRASPS